MMFNVVNNKKKCERKKKQGESLKGIGLMIDIITSA